MRLKEIIAEYLYLKEAKQYPLCSFREQESNVRDYYCKEASKEIPRILGGYLSSKGNLYKVIDGAVKSFLEAHKELNLVNRGSLTKRIIKAIKNEERNIIKATSNAFRGMTGEDDRAQVSGGVTLGTRRLVRI